MSPNNIKRICFVANQGQHYRFPIFKRIDEEMTCDFYLGDHLQTPIKPFNYADLKGYVKTLKNHFFGNFYWQSGVVALVRKPYDAYIFTGEPFCLSTWLFMLLSKFTRKQTICWTHGWYGKEGRIKTWIKKIYFSLFSDIWVYGEYAIKLMEQEGIAPQKMRCIANSLDSDNLKAIRQQLKPTTVYQEHFGNSNPVIIYCGRIQQVKRIDLLLQCIHKLKAESHQVNLIVIGKDVDGVNLQQQAQQLGIVDQVWFYGPCYDNLRLGELFYNAHVCVSPGNIGLTVIHALSFGCPALTHNNFAYQMPEFEAIKPGETGDFFKMNDMEDMAEKVKTWTQKTSEAREATRRAAFSEIDRKWNVDYQMNIIKQTIYG